MPAALAAMVAAASFVATTATAGADHEAGHVEVTTLAGNELNKCQGAMPTDGSANTDKRLVGGTLVPGGTAVFEFSYPFDPTAANGRDDFVILDCVFVDDVPAMAFELHGVPNDVSPFVFQFTVDIPANVPVGAEFCNVGKTTAAPSSPQGSNRKAGPACFVVGGGVRVVKVDEAGAPLMGASFRVVCTPSSALLPVVIEGTTGAEYTGTTGADNAISISGPLGTTCTVTETGAPAGYELSTTVATASIVPAAGDVVVVNRRSVGDIVITKTSDAPGDFRFTVDCPGTDVVGRVVEVPVPTAGTPATSAPVSGIPTGTVCTVSEAVATGFVPQPAQTVTVAAGTNTVTFTNVRTTGTLVVTKRTVGGNGTFEFKLNCHPGQEFDQVFTLSGGQEKRIDGIPTGTKCTVVEKENPAFTTVVDPVTGQVVIAPGNNVIAFTNTLRTTVLGVVKTADAASVTAGTGVGFTVTVTNAGTATAAGVTLDDPLPGAAGVSWTVDPAYTGPGTCAVSGVAPQVLGCAFGDLAPGASASVHVRSATSAATAVTLANTATARATNAGPVSASATVVVGAPPVIPAVLPTIPQVLPTIPAVVPSSTVTEVAATAPVAPTEVAGIVVTKASPDRPQRPGRVAATELARTGAGGLVPMALGGAFLVALGVALRQWGGGRPARAVVKVRRRR